jgi:predicted lysophospholipase L1 biosynthesis ABC-type transport system permease subunit
MSLGNGGELDVEIVGLVANARLNHPKNPHRPHFFFPYRQGQEQDLGSAHVYLRGHLGTPALLRAVPEVVARVDPELPVDGLLTLESQIRDSTRAERAVATLALAFAGLATLLAVLGLYGVLAHAVAQRRREIGVRMALGADATCVRSLVLAQVGRSVLAGSALGLLAALAAGRLVESVLFGVRAHDPSSLGGAVVLLGGVALLAGWLPARRACRIDPAIALRAE